MENVDYKLSRHRFKELKHFCLQYLEWEQRYLELGGRAGKKQEDVTSKDAIEMADIKRALQLIETTAYDTDSIFGEMILEFVTHDKSLSELEVDKDVFQLYLYKFYWLLSDRKGI